MNMLKPLLYFLFLFFPAILFAQKSTVDLKIDELIEEAKTYMASGQYEEANIVFRKVLQLKANFPANMCYHFAETLFMIGQYQNSINFLEKYFELTGKAGDYYKQSLELKTFLELKLSAIKKCELCDFKGYKLLPCDRCQRSGQVIAPCHYCKGLGVVNCTSCMGEGVVIIQDIFGERHYEACEKCNSKGHITCTLCTGSLEIQQRCPTCNGAGSFSSHEICSHSK